MKKDAKMVPKGFRPPRNAAAMPLKPMPGTEEVEHCHCSYPVRYSMAAPIPARAPEMTKVRMILRFSAIPQYLAAFLLLPVARSS